MSVSREERITSSQNDVIKLCKRLHRKKHRDSSNLCLLEGRRLIEDVADWTRLKCLLLADDVRCEARAERVCRVPEKLLAACCDTSTPQGAVAIATMPEQKADFVDWALVLDSISDPGNVGALIRSAAAAAVQAVLCVGDCADPFSPKALRAAMGATFKQPVLFCDNWSAAYDLLRSRWHLKIRVADLSEDSVPYDRLNSWAEAALVVGGEVGLSSDLVCLLEDAERHDHLSRIHIPINPNVDSLNAAVAGSVLLLDAHRLRRQANASEVAAR